MVTSTPEPGDYSVKNTVDGDPSSLCLPGATSATWTYDFTSLGVWRIINGYAVCNHNLLGATLAFSVYDGTWHQLDSRVINTPDDFLLDFGVNAYHATRAKLVITGATANIRVGIISVICDYGYNSTGVLTQGSNYGQLLLTAEGGVRRPIGRSADPNLSSTVSISGFAQVQRLGSPLKSFRLQIDYMKTALDQDFWKIVNSFAPVVDDAYTNQGWSKGVWLTTDEYVLASAYSAHYVRANPGSTLDWQIIIAGGRETALLQLTTMSKA